MIHPNGMYHLIFSFWHIIGAVHGFCPLNMWSASTNHSVPIYSITFWMSVPLLRWNSRIFASTLAMQNHNPSEPNWWYRISCYLSLFFFYHLIEKIPNRILSGGQDRLQSRIANVQRFADLVLSVAHPKREWGWFFRSSSFLFSFQKGWPGCLISFPYWTKTGVFYAVHKK